jgi:tetratricopeptide (TPR) repeat protein
MDPLDKNWQPNSKSIFYGLMAGILLVYAVILIPRNNDWEDDFALFSADAVTSPNSVRTHAALGFSAQLKFEGSKNDAEKKRFYNMAVREYVRSISIYNNYPDVYYNLGNTYYEGGSQDSALVMYQKVIALRKEIEDSLARSKQNAAVVVTGDNHIQSLLSPTGYAKALNNVGSIYYNKTKYDTALHYFQLATTIDSNLYTRYENLGKTEIQKKDFEKARYYFTLVQTRDPGNANIPADMYSLYCNIGADFYGKQQYDKAVEQFLNALNYDHSATAFGNVAASYQLEGDNAKAIEYYQKALAIDPGNKTFAQYLTQLKGNKK